MSTTGTLKMGFGATCGTCKTEFSDELFDTIQELNKEMLAERWQIHPTCCSKCIEKLGVWYTDDRHPQDFLQPDSKNDKPTKKAAGDDTGPVRRRMRRRLL